MDDDQQQVRFGDYIIIIGTVPRSQQATTSSPKSSRKSVLGESFKREAFQKKVGFLSCTGFTDNRVQYQSVPPSLFSQEIHTDTNLDKTQSSFAVIRNFRDFLFQIQPKLNYEAHKELHKQQKIVQHLAKDKSDIEKQNNFSNSEEQLKYKLDDDQKRLSSQSENNEEHQQLHQMQQAGQGGVEAQNGEINNNMDDSQHDGGHGQGGGNAGNGLQSASMAQMSLELRMETRLKALQTRCQAEKEQNQKLMNTMTNQVISYGSEVQFQHVDSKSFLIGKILVSETEKTAYRFELSDQYSAGMVFAIMPKYKLRQIGDPVFYMDRVIIKNVKLNCFINVNLEEKNSQQLNIEDHYKVMKSSMKLYQQYQEQQNALKKFSNAPLQIDTNLNQDENIKQQHLNDPIRIEEVKAEESLDESSQLVRTKQPNFNNQPQTQISIFNQIQSKVITEDDFANNSLFSASMHPQQQPQPQEQQQQKKIIKPQSMSKQPSEASIVNTIQNYNNNLLISEPPNPPMTSEKSFQHIISDAQSSEKIAIEEQLEIPTDTMPRKASSDKRLSQVNRAQTMPAENNSLNQQNLGPDKIQQLQQCFTLMQQKPYQNIETRSIDNYSHMHGTFLSKYSDIIWQFKLKFRQTPSSMAMSELGQQQEQQQQNLATTVLSSATRVQSSNLVRLRHAEDNGLLCADICYQDQQDPEVYLRIYNGQYAQEKQSAAAVWEIEQENQLDGQQYCEFNTEEEMNQLEGRRTSSYTGGNGLDKKQVKYLRLRHFLTGRLLGIKVTQPQIQPKGDNSLNAEGGGTMEDLNNSNQIISLLTPFEERTPAVCDDDNSLIYFVGNEGCAGSNSEEDSGCYLCHKNCYHIGIGREDFSYLKVNKKRNYGLRKQQFRTVSGFYQPISDNDLCIKRLQVVAGKERDDNQVFWLEMVDPAEVNDLLYIRSSIPSLWKLKMIYELSLDKNFLKSDLFSQVAETMEKLIFFLIEREDTNQQDDPITCDGASIVSRQKMMCDMRLIEILTELLYYPFKNRYYNFYEKGKEASGYLYNTTAVTNSRQSSNRNITINHKDKSQQQQQKGKLTGSQTQQQQQQLNTSGGTAKALQHQQSIQQKSLLMEKCSSDQIRIFKLAYRLIKFIIREFRPNEIYASQFIDLFIKQALQFAPQYDILAEPTLTELIDNNTFILENKINSKMITRFVQQLIYQKSEKSIKLVRALINNDGQAMVKNQHQISVLLQTQYLWHLTQQLKELKQIIKSLSMSKGGLKKASKILQQKQKMSIMHQNITSDALNKKSVAAAASAVQDATAILQTEMELSYYYSFILLCSDLCLDKNYIAIDNLNFKEQLPIDFCYDIISSPNYPFELRTAFTQLIITLWLDSQGLQLITLPNCMRVWEQIQLQRPSDAMQLKLIATNEQQNMVVKGTGAGSAGGTGAGAGVDGGGGRGQNFNNKEGNKLEQAIQDELMQNKPFSQEDDIFNNKDYLNQQIKNIKQFSIAYLNSITQETEYSINGNNCRQVDMAQLYNASVRSKASSTNRGGQARGGIAPVMNQIEHKIKCYRFQRMWECEKNQFTLMILRLVETLINYGLFNVICELNELVQPLMLLLNASNDMTTREEERKRLIIMLNNPYEYIKNQQGLSFKEIKSKFSEFKQHERFKVTSESQILMDCRCTTLQILQMIIHINCELQCNQLLYSFKQWAIDNEIVNLDDRQAEAEGMGEGQGNGIGQGNGNGGNEGQPLVVAENTNYRNEVSDVGNSRQALNPASTDVNKLQQKALNLRQERVDRQTDKASKSPETAIASAKNNKKGQNTLLHRDYNKELVNQSKEWLEQVITSQLINFSCGPINFSQLLMDLLMYDSKKLNNISIQIFNLIFSERQRLLDILQQISLIDTREKISMMNTMINLQMSLNRHSEMTEIWLEPVNSLISGGDQSENQDFNEQQQTNILLENQIHSDDEERDPQLEGRRLSQQLGGPLQQQQSSATQIQRKILSPLNSQLQSPNSSNSKEKSFILTIGQKQQMYQDLVSMEIALSNLVKLQQILFHNNHAHTDNYNNQQPSDNNMQRHYEQQEESPSRNQAQIQFPYSLATNPQATTAAADLLKANNKVVAEEDESSNLILDKSNRTNQQLQQHYTPVNQSQSQNNSLNTKEIQMQLQASEQQQYGKPQLTQSPIGLAQRQPQPLTSVVDDRHFQNHLVMLKFIDKEAQKLMRNLSIYKSLLEFMQNDLQFLKQLRSQKSEYIAFVKKSESFQQFRTIISLTCRVLGLFCLDNMQNQELLEQHIDFFIEHQSLCAEEGMAVDCNTYIVIQEIFRNNRTLLYQPNIVEAAAYSIVDGIHTFMGPERIMHLNSLSIFVKHNKVIIKANQGIIMSALSQSKYSNILILPRDLDKDRFKYMCELLSKQINLSQQRAGHTRNTSSNAFNFSAQQQIVTPSHHPTHSSSSQDQQSIFGQLTVHGGGPLSSPMPGNNNARSQQPPLSGGLISSPSHGFQNPKEFEIPQDLDYFCTQMEILSMSAEEKNAATESKCQSYFAIQDLKKLMEMAKYCWPVRKWLFLFFYNVYLDIEREIEDSQIVTEIANYIKHDLAYFSKHIKQMRQSVKDDYYLLSFKEKIGQNKIVNEYVYSVLLKIIEIVMVKGYFATQPFDVIQNFYLNVLDSLINIATIETENDIIINFSTCKPMRHHESCRHHFLAKLFSYFQNKFHIQNASEYDELMLPQKIRELSCSSDSSGCAGNSSKAKMQQAQLRLITEGERMMKYNMTVVKSRPEKQDTKLNSFLQKGLQEFVEGPEFQSAEYEEFQESILSIMNIEKSTFRNYKGLNIINLDNLLQKLIQLIDPKKSELSSKLNLMGLKIFRKIIEMENRKRDDKNQPISKISISQWSSEDYDGFEKMIKQRQDQLVDFGVVEVVCNVLLLDDSEQELKSEAVLLGIALLLGGNRGTQEKFYEFLQQDDRNLVMISIQKLIEEDLQIIRGAMERQNKKMLDMNKKKDFDQQSNNMSVGSQGKKLNLDEEEEALDPSYRIQEEMEFVNKKIEELTSCYRFLQLFCEGHFIKMQDYLRVQRQYGQINVKSINFISQLAIQFGIFIRIINSDCIGLGSQLLDFLIESLQGPCLNNQQCLTSSKIVDFIKELMKIFQKKQDLASLMAQTTLGGGSTISSNLAKGGTTIQQFQQHQTHIGDEYMQRGFTTKELVAEADELVSKSTKLLLALIEGNKDPYIGEFLNSNLDFNFLRKKLKDEYLNFVAELGVENPKNLGDVQESLISNITLFEGNIDEAFSMYILFVTLADLLKYKGDENNAGQALKEISDDTLENNAMEFFKNNTLNIEINFKDQLFRVFFPKQPCCNLISKFTREKFMVTVKRDAPNDKITGLINECPRFIAEMEHLSYLRKYKFITSHNLDKLRNLSTLIAFLNNLTLIATANRELRGDNTSEIVLDESSTIIMQVLGFIQLVTSSLMLLFWIFINAPVILKLQWKAAVENNAENLDQNLEDLLDEKHSPMEFSTDLMQYCLKTKGPYHKCFTVHGERSFGSLFGWLLWLEKSIIFLLSDPSLLYICFYIVVSIIGLFYSPIIYSFHLLDIVNRFPMLQNVIVSVTGNFMQLSLTFFLMLILLYIFTMIGFTFLREDWWSPLVDQANGGENMCSTLFQCYLWTIEQGLVFGGGISEGIRYLSYAPEIVNRYYVRFLFDITFCIVINIMFLNLLFGIIIDTFAGLREEKMAMTEDMKNKCFICGMERYIFEKNADGFINHIERDHQCWNYVFYLYYLEKKDPTEFNGIESYIQEKLDVEDISWFPIMKSISINMEDEKDKDQIISKQLEKVKSGIQNIFEKLNRVNIK